MTAYEVWYESFDVVLADSPESAYESVNHEDKTIVAIYDAVTGEEFGV